MEFCGGSDLSSVWWRNEKRNCLSITYFGPHKRKEARQGTRDPAEAAGLLRQGRVQRTKKRFKIEYRELEDTSKYLWGEHIQTDRQSQQHYIPKPEVVFFSFAAECERPHFEEKAQYDVYHTKKRKVAIEEVNRNTKKQKKKQQQQKKKKQVVTCVQITCHHSCCSIFCSRSGSLVSLYCSAGSPACSS